MTMSNPLIPYPWQQPLWQNFLQKLEQQRMPHATLLAGQKGIGKWHYAQAMANYLLCLSPKSGLPCNTCRSCQLNEAGSHPDKMLVVPEEAGKQIKIDQIRQLSAQASTTAQQGGRKVILLTPVEQLNVNAANALLKNLEEPAQDTFFILVSNVVSGVMPTIRSRCQIVPCPMPEQGLVRSWLKDLGITFSDMDLILEMSANAPLRAQSLMDNNRVEKLECFYSGLLKAQQSAPSIDITIAKDWLELELTDLLEWWLQLLQRTVTSGFKVSSPLKSAELSFVNMITEIQAQAKFYNQQWLFRFMDKLLLAKKQLLYGGNPNKQLLLEELLLDWYAIIKSAKQDLVIY